MVARRLTDSEVDAELGDVFLAVFNDPSAAHAPFTDGVRCREIIYPLAPNLGRRVVDALLTAAGLVRDPIMYVQALGLEESSCYEVGSFDDFAPIASEEMFIYGSRGSWGVRVYEDFAIVGGSAEFLEHMTASLPRPDIPEYINSTKYHDRGWSALRIDWLEGLFTHVYGDQQANELLSEAGAFRARRVPQDEVDGAVGIAFKSVFASIDPFGEPFTEAVSSRAILHPVGYELTESEFTCLMEAAGLVGDTQMYVSLFEESGRPYYEVSTSSEYETIAYPSQSALFGPTGKWGVIISCEDHAVVGGPAEVLDHLRACLPPAEPYHTEDEAWEPVPFDRQVHAFIEYVKWVAKGNRLDWLPTLLKHVYGDQRARELLAEFDLTT